MHADTIIVGAGLSGLYTALLINPSRNVTIIVKDRLEGSNSKLAQGGIAAALLDEKNALSSHLQDTLKAGSHMNDKEAVKILVESANANIEQLIAFNVNFDKTETGTFKTTKEGGHTISRVLHSGGDATGRDMMRALLRHVHEKPNITILQDTMAVDIIMEDGEAVALKTLNKHGLMHYIPFSECIIATGGCGAIYGKTTNAPGSTGDGIAMAHRAAITCEKMAFVQFHPTALHEATYDNRQAFLLTEAMRGEGAMLVNRDGEPFMKRYHEDGDLAPRDIVSQAIVREMYDTWSDHVYLDTRHLDSKKLNERFPTIAKALQSRGLTLGIDLIPVVPVQHFLIGGIKTDYEGKTSLPNVYAVGEAASTGVHGANRLAANSLLECVVFGKRIAEHINNKKPRETNYEPYKAKITPKNFNYAPIHKNLGTLMDDYVSIVRRSSGLKTAKARIESMLETLTEHPFETTAYHETRNMLTVAKLITEDALNRTESIGCHVRID